MRHRVGQHDVPAISGHGQRGAERAGYGRRHHQGDLDLLANGSAPDTTDASLDIYRQQFLAMYPITAVNMSFGDQITTDYPINWTNVLDQMRTKRAADAPAADVYYFGLLKPAATFAAFWWELLHDRHRLRCRGEHTGAAGRGGHWFRGRSVRPNHDPRGRTQPRSKITRRV